MGTIYLEELYSGPGDLKYAIARLTDEYVYNFTSGVFENNLSPAFQPMTNPSQGIYEGSISDGILQSGVDYAVDYIDSITLKVATSTSLNNYLNVQYSGTGIVYVPSGVVYIPSGTQTVLVPSGYPVYINVGGSTSPNISTITYNGTRNPVGGGYCY